ncbi:GDSL-type esterase/lipase family protein [Lysinibacillus fusiformis]|uniref:GDSL-type esterase/lipase family protein n=1 Tax=Lysinibacillus fusiformis TaxID=28031 RepID=UPI00263BE080|nr:GDSL-type esterase/lipase family protein [Lysinibacillus fusiformis]MDC6267372.1 GDSL-type esterase/lipase family protein [Lysinibacillus sphaericus]MDN4968194.1 GDSL-type esterase/lipase family protein [Lysinibacillus fusiformis]MDN4968368.1 GDSL-type esterase/lipase family protein [Lysinibacillus fusiformis]
MNRYEGSPAVIIERRKGTPDSPFSDINESHVIAGDGKVILTEIPNELNRVIVTSDDSTVWYEIKNGQVPLNGFKVDYVNKIVTFNNAHSGKQLHFKYFGEGNHYYSPHSIYTKLDKGTVVETLGDIIDNGFDALDALDKLDQKLDEVNQATNNAITVTNNAKDVITEGNQVIETTNDKISEINSTINEATTKISELDTELSKAQSTIEDVQQKTTVVEGIITDGQGVITNAQLLLDEIKSAGNFNLLTFYKKNNTVLDSKGSTWIALKDTQHNPLPILPVTENTYWRLSALHGEKGEKGDTGAALSILGKLTNVSELPTSGQAGDAYTINGELFVWSDNTHLWENVGNVKGEKGDIGEQGESAYEVAVYNGFIGTLEEWLTSLKGEKGDKGQDADLTEVNQEISNLQQNITNNHSEVLEQLETKASNIQIESIRQIGFNDYMMKELIQKIRNPFKRSNIKLLGDSITAGMGGTGYDPSGESIGTTGFKTNVPIATCWANSFKSYIENKYAKDILIPMNNKNINYSVSYSNGFESFPNSIVGTQFVFRNSDTPTVNFTFFGDRFIIYHAKIPAGGILDVYVDGLKIGEINGQGDLSSKNEKVFQNLNNQKHEVELRGNTSGNVVFIEAIQIPNQARVKNWGISGMDSRYFYQNINTLIEADDDIVIVELGTNDRANTLNTATLQTFQQGIIDKCIALNKTVILMSANAVSTANDNEVIRNYKMAQVDEAIFDLSTQNSLKFISNFSAFEKYALQYNVTIDSLLDDGLHPNDRGYYVMFNNIINELGL